MKLKNCHIYKCQGSAQKCQKQRRSKRIPKPQNIQINRINYKINKANHTIAWNAFILHITQHM